jgi:hypothetical protein
LWLACFVVFWVFVCYLISLLGGWFSLSTRYRRPAGLRPYDAAWMVSMSVGLSSYRSCVNLRADNGGLYVGMSILFRAGHAPLFIPWHDLQPLRPYRFLWVQMYPYRVRGATLTFWGRSARFVNDQFSRRASIHTAP